MSQVKNILKDIPLVKVLVDTDEKQSNNNVGLYLLKAQYALEQKQNSSGDLLSEVNDLACVYCERLFQRTQLTVDHFKPRYLKGTNDPENLVLACEECNKAKGSIDPVNMPVVFQEFLSQVKQGIWNKRLPFLKQMSDKVLSETERKLLNKLIKMENRPYEIKE